jgi:fido (protein-threonine AMPylation protein)
MAVAYKWHPISNLEADPASLTDGELGPLGRVWQSLKKDLAERDVLSEFDQRIRREWAIETGIIEDVYTLDRGITRTLIEKGIDAALIPRDATDKDTLLVSRIIQDHYEGLEGMFDFVGGQRQLSTSYIKELHAALLRNIDTHTVVDRLGRVFEKPLEKGQYKSEPNSPTRPDGNVHEYCPPEHVASEMDQLVQMYLCHQGSRVPPEVEAAWLHHRFAQIHPFSDGNGRVARALASLVFIRAGWFPLIIKREDRARYIEALDKADAEDLRPLVSLFVECQRTALIDASEIAYDMRPISSTEEAILAVRDRLLQRGRLPLPEWLRVKGTAEHLLRLAREHLANVAAGLNREIANVSQGFSFMVTERRGEADSLRDSAVRAAGLVPDFVVFNATATLSLNTGRPDALVLSFQGIGPRFRGFIGVVGYLLIHGTRTMPPEENVFHVFQINYEEDIEAAKSRFTKWLDQAIVRALDQWRRTL